MEGGVGVGGDLQHPPMHTLSGTIEAKMLKQPVGIAAPSPMKKQGDLAHKHPPPLYQPPFLPRHIVPGVGSAAGRQSDDDDGDDDEDEDEEHPTPPLPRR